ncbi:MAG: ubiquinol-cytochrome c reductase iron-sulfur subunit [Lysobacteraceae bacterium]
MATQEVNTGRRRLLTASTAVVGAVGVVGLAVPFIRSWEPSARAQVAGAPVEVDISRLQVGERVTVTWRGQTVWLIRRSDEQLAALDGERSRLRDPDSDNTAQQPEYARNPHRSIRPEVLVLIATCTHLGCIPTFRPELLPQPFDANWQGGFYCPCHNSRFDMAGRVYGGVPAPTNLRVPPHRFADDNIVVVGEDHEGAA